MLRRILLGLAIMLAVALGAFYAWSEEAFRRAMREGVARDGTHLYPAFPYDHFTRLTDGDISALYAFLMTREPAAQANRQPQLDFPLNFRIFAAGWQLLFLSKGPYRNDPAQSAAWNRGAYLVEGVGHCGGCHTPRNAFGAERKHEAYGGGAKYSIINSVGINSTFPSIARQARLNAGWDMGDYSVSVFMNNVGGHKNWGGGTINPLILDANGNASGGGDYVKSWTTFDLHASWDFSHEGPLGDSQVYVDVNNLFNVAPPFFNTSSGYDSFGANPLGRVMSFGIRARW